MSFGKLASSRGARRGGAPRRASLALLGCALALAGCGAIRVQPATSSGSTALASRGRIDSPLVDMHNHLGCIRGAHLPVQVLGPTKLQIGPAPSGPTIVFTATPGAAQNYQIEGKAQGAEAIGTALLYPNQGGDTELASLEACLDQGVHG
jgi:hypothetical protein